jgi:hypothetical protein
MSAEMIDRVAEVADRKRFLMKVGAASLGVMAGVLGVSEDAPAYGGAHGCCLCAPPGSPPCPSLGCGWCWWGKCHQNDDGPKHHTHCCEGYSGPHPCPGSCGEDWVCSYYGGRMDGCNPNVTPILC